MSPGKIVKRDELKRLAVLKRQTGEILRISLDRATDSDGEAFHFVSLRPWHPVGPDRHQPASFTIAVLADELPAIRDAITAAIDLIPAHETVTEPPLESAS